MKPPVFLLSSERSGTNLLRRRFTEYQKDYFGPAPLHLLKHLHWAEPYYGGLENDINFDQFIQDALGLAYNHFSPWDEEITVSQVRAEYDTLFTRGRSSVGVMHVIYTLYAYRKGYSSYFCKDNNLFDFTSDIKLELPEAKFVYLYRDPRDVVVSQTKRPLQNKSIAFLSSLWREEQIKCIRYAESLRKNGDVFILSYEELTKNEKKCIRGLCEFVGAEFLSEKNELYLKEKTDIQEWKNLNKPTLKENSGKFRKALSVSQIKKIESICWNQMQWLGYNTDYNERARFDNKKIMLDIFLGKVRKSLSSRIRKASVTSGQKGRAEYTSRLQKKWR